jgi:hypothetical protein
LTLLGNRERHLEVAVCRVMEGPMDAFRGIDDFTVIYDVATGVEVTHQALSRIFSFQPLQSASGYPMYRAIVQG